MSGSKEFGYPSFVIHDLVKRPKKSMKLPALQKYREEGRQYDFPVYLTDEERFVPMRMKISAGRLDDRSTYEAAFILDGERVRGVGYCEVSKKRYYNRAFIPKGWHQNLIDPNLDREDANQNRHDGLINWTVTDFEDFLKKVCALWNIDLGKERELL